MESSQPKVNMFAEKFNKYGNMLYRLSMVYLKNTMDSEDIIQDAFIKLLYKAPEFRDDEHEKSWLLRITINLCKDKLKEAWRRKKRSLDETLMVEQKVAEDNLLEQIMSMPAKLKAPIHLYYYEGYTVREIAEILGIGVSAVKMRMKRGREFLKKELENDEDQ